MWISASRSGGDGTILRGLRQYAGTGVPVFGVNFGEVGFLATVEREDARSAFERAMAREFDVLALPGIAARVKDGDWIAINDVSVERQHGQRVATLAYSVDADELGRVRCDGLVVATPAGSTGYNLANGGPVMAWGVEGMVVSFIAPHSLTARALVVAPGDTLAIENQSERRAGRRHDRRPPGRRPGTRGQARGALRRQAGLPGSARGRELLPPDAREVRAAGDAALVASGGARKIPPTNACSCCSVRG